MFGHKSYLVVGGDGAADIVSLIKGGYEILDCHFSFEQGIDAKGQVKTWVYGGSIHITLSQLPPKPLVEWALNSRKYMDGAVIILDHENVPLSKILFKNAACIGLEMNYTHQGESYMATKLVIQAETIVVGDGIDFMNEWVF
jgi:hypothetical protein